MIFDINNSQSESSPTVKTDVALSKQNRSDRDSPSYVKFWLQRPYGIFPLENIVVSIQRMLWLSDYSNWNHLSIFIKTLDWYNHYKRHEQNIRNGLFFVWAWEKHYMTRSRAERNSCRCEETFARKKRIRARRYPDPPSQAVPAIAGRPTASVLLSSKKAPEVNFTLTFCFGTMVRKIS